MRGLKDQFATMLDQLERCQKALNSFLEEKRSAFPRLYFIGDEDLLEILGQSSNPEVIQDRILSREYAITRGFLCFHGPNGGFVSVEDSFRHVRRTSRSSSRA